ncbi:MAG TPA: ribulose-phosphate 3-epimerase [Gemmatimonadales bacterium]
MTVQIAPSLLSADIGHLADDIAVAVEGGADMIHIDVMDGRFVPNLTFGANVVGAARRATDLPLDVHLMVVEPERYIEAFAEAGATTFTFHPEATTHVQRQLDLVREAGMRPGLALNPGTPLAFAEEVIDDLALLLVMTVNPGYGAQRYLPASNGKIARARALLNATNSAIRLEVDGGISVDTIGRAYAAGADTFVAGTAVYGSANPREAIRELRRRCAVSV